MRHQHDTKIRNLDLLYVSTKVPVGRAYDPFVKNVNFAK